MTDPDYGTKPGTDEASVTGRVWIHSAPAALCPHIEWAFAAANITAGGFGDRRIRPAWAHQLANGSSHGGTAGGAAVAAYCCEVELACPESAIRKLVADLMRWENLAFEIAIDASLRICVTPELGYFEAATDEAGNIQVGEMQLRAIMAQHAGDAEALTSAIDAALGGPWDKALEPLRMGAAGFAPEEIAAMCQTQTQKQTQPETQAPAQRLRAV